MLRGWSSLLVFELSVMMMIQEKYNIVNSQGNFVQIYRNLLLLIIKSFNLLNKKKPKKLENATKKINKRKQKRF